MKVRQVPWPYLATFLHKLQHLMLIIPQVCGSLDGRAIRGSWSNISAALHDMNSISSLQKNNKILELLDTLAIMCIQSISVMQQ